MQHPILMGALLALSLAYLARVAIRSHIARRRIARRLNQG